MSVEQVRSTVGQDGIDVAVTALKEIAADADQRIAEDIRVRAAEVLLSYGLASIDDFGNAVA